VLDVAVVSLPRIANFTDLDALAVEPGVGVRLVDHPGALGRPDLVILPGTKATVADLAWLRGRGLDAALTAARADGSVVLGICGGLQMLGMSITDDVESGAGSVDGLGWLDVKTVFEPDKVTRQRRGTAFDRRVTGYQIHHGRVTGADGWITLDDTYGREAEGSADGKVFGTTLHGLFEEDGFRAAFLGAVAAARGKQFVPSGVAFAAARDAQIERLADVLEAHLDMAAIEAIIAARGRP
jgi:adenosylcobyric acid synthase